MAQSQEILNAKIDTIYEQLSYLIAQRSRQKTERLEEQIAVLSHQLRELQKQEADMVRAYTKELLGGPIAEGLEILRNAKAILP